ncbi:hypothetical protein Goshw_002231 [Gossypium schwendimanii]|uniref:Uncharacterized protein n=1 Tax=Gossypium schwendimanii TaxID=34291 RepID=A0A7J9N2P0_GOSSC|nr:hypothetical protein [Gossypium schwendimanii]
MNALLQLISSTLVKVGFSVVHFGPYGEIETKEYMKEKSEMGRKLQTSSRSTLTVHIMRA